MATPVSIPQSVRELVAKAPLAHLTTLSSKGGPQVTVVWVGIENDEFVIGHLAVHQKVRNIRRDPRVALSMLSDTPNALGLREYLVVYGDARVTDGARWICCAGWRRCISVQAPTFRRPACAT